STTLNYSLSLHDALPISIFPLVYRARIEEGQWFAVKRNLVARPHQVDRVTGQRQLRPVNHRPTGGDPVKDLHHGRPGSPPIGRRSEEHTSELQSRENLVC